MMIIEVAKTEQRPYTFETVPATVPYEVRRVTLKTADYRVRRPAPADPAAAACAIVERKSLCDLYQTLSRGRTRFERELARMRPFGFKAIVIEAEWSQILQPNLYLVKPTRMAPKAVLASLLAWQQRYAVHVYTCPGRPVAERITFRLLERWFRDGGDCKDVQVRTGVSRGDHK